MIDPLNGLSLAVNIVQTLEFGWKIVSKYKEISANGATDELVHLKAISSNMDRIYDELRREAYPPNPAQFAKQDHSDVCSAFYGDNQDLSQRLNARKKELAVEELAAKGKQTVEELEKLLGNLEVENILDRQGNSRKRKRDILSSAVDTTWQKAHLDKLRTRLHDLQEAMMFKLLVFQNETSANLIEGLAWLSKRANDDRRDRAKGFESMKSEILDRIRAMNVSCADETMEKLAQAFNKMSKQITDVAGCHSALNLLRFPEIHDRQEYIAVAHSKTFEWVFESADLGFTHWASSQDGIFWITGKPGSGKSTLMKFLVTDPRTKALLQQWSGSTEAVISHHYFWNAGTPMQKSQIGLLRSLLYSILRQSPETALRLFPQRFQDQYGDTQTPWTLEELRECFQALGRQPDLGVRICLFIDGLDEYSGEHIDLIALLAELGKGRNVKLCISSRPWNTFTRAYHNRTDGQFAMQDLTESDIRLYISDTMNRSNLFVDLARENLKGCTELIEEVIKKAQGVFLWVYLAVRSLLRGLDNEDSLDILHQRLVSYPEKLDDFFRRMFERIEDVYRLHSARIMLVALTTEKPMPLCFVKYIEVEFLDPDYALKATFQKFAPTNLPLSVTHRYQRYIDARCADLLELKGGHIHLIHRTAADFLRQNKILNEIHYRARWAFDPGLSLARLALIRFKRGENFDTVQSHTSSVDWATTSHGHEFYRRMYRELEDAEPLIEPQNAQNFLKLLEQIPQRARYSEESSQEMLHQANSGVGIKQKSSDAIYEKPQCSYPMCDELAPWRE